MTWHEKRGLKPPRCTTHTPWHAMAPSRSRTCIRFSVRVAAFEAPPSPPRPSCPPYSNARKDRRQPRGVRLRCHHRQGNGPATERLHVAGGASGRRQGCGRVGDRISPHATEQVRRARRDTSQTDPSASLRSILRSRAGEVFEILYLRCPLLLFVLCHVCHRGRLVSLLQEAIASIFVCVICLRAF